MSIEYANAYSEVLELLKYVSKSDYEKIPNNLIELFINNYNDEYVFEYDMKKTLEEQGVSELARTIIAIMFRDYWSTEEQKNKILEFQKNLTIKEEEEKSKKYIYDDLFKNNKLNKNEEIVENEKNLIVYKENIFKKIINKIYSFLKHK